jgi:hypothetical protein
VQRIKVNEGSTVRSVKTLSQYSLSGGISKGLPAVMKRRFCFGRKFWFAALRTISDTVVYHAAASVKLLQT